MVLGSVELEVSGAADVEVKSAEKVLMEAFVETADVEAPALPLFIELSNAASLF